MIKQRARRGGLRPPVRLASLGEDYFIEVVPKPSLRHRAVVLLGSTDTAAPSLIDRLREEFDSSDNKLLANPIIKDGSPPEQETTWRM